MKNRKAAIDAALEKLSDLIDGIEEDEKVPAWAYCNAQIMLWMRSLKGERPWLGKPEDYGDEGMPKPPSREYVRGWDARLKHLIDGLDGGLHAYMDDEKRILRLARALAKRG